jgi:hypothetical protein
MSVYSGMSQKLQDWTEPELFVKETSNVRNRTLLTNK